MNKSGVIGVCIFALLAVIGLFVYFNHHNKSLTEQRTELESELSVAQTHVQTSQDDLDNITHGTKDAYPLGATTQDQMIRTTSVVHQTDYMFRGANSSDPHFIISTNVNLDTQRREINTLLEKWQAQVNIQVIQSIDIEQAKRIRAEAQTIREYIQDLSNTVHNLTPGNSGLSELQIDTYIDKLPSIDYIDQVIALLDEAINTAVNNPTPNPSSPTLSNEIIKQQQEVIKATKDVEEIQKKIDEIDIQTPLTPTSPSATSGTPDASPTPTPDSPSATPATPTPTTPTPGGSTPVSPTTPNPNPNQNPTPVPTPTPGSPFPSPLPGSPPPTTPEPTPEPARVFNKSSGIIIQPGPPKLIEGDNEY